MLAEIIDSPDSSNHTPNKHSTPLVSTFRAITDARKRHLNIALISLFTCKQIQKAHWQCCKFFFSRHLKGLQQQQQREKKKTSVGFPSSIVASESLAEKYNTPQEALLRLNTLFPAHLCFRLSLLSAAFSQDRNRLFAPCAWCIPEDFRGLSYFKTWESADITANLTTL